MAGATQTGAAAGSAFGPWGMVIGAAVGAVVDVVSTPAPPSNADAVFSNGLAFDNSGWNVAFGESSIDSTSKSTLNQGGVASIGAGSGGMAGMYGFGGTSAKSLFNTQAAFDNSGWNVSFGKSSITSAATKTTTQEGIKSTVGAGETYAPGGLGLDIYTPYLLAALGGVVLWKMSKKS